MPLCDYTEECIFFDGFMPDAPNTSSIYRTKYCEAGFKHCARYITANVLGHEKVPSDLFPHHVDKVIRILRH